MNNPRFDLINRYKVSIKSLQNKLKNSKNTDELTVTAGKIIELEELIFLEKTAKIKTLEKKKQAMELSLAKMQKDISNTQKAIAEINSTITNISSTHTSNIDILSETYVSLSDVLKN